MDPRWYPPVPRGSFGSDRNGHSGTDSYPIGTVFLRPDEGKANVRPRAPDRTGSSRDPLMM